MGCCVSKCSSRTESREEDEEASNVQDKRIITNYPDKVPSVPMMIKAGRIPIPDKRIHVPIRDELPPSPLKSVALSSPLTSTASNCTITSSFESSSLSSATSGPASKDGRPFSNEFLRVCYSRNPHIVRINSIKEASISLAAPTKIPSPQRFRSPARPHASPLGSPARPYASPLVSRTSNSNAKRVTDRSILQKRPRPSSPIHGALARQKSFRKDLITNPSCSFPSSRNLRSPSATTRFNTEGSNSRVFAVNSVSLPRRNESRWPPNPSRINSRVSRPCLRKSETRVHRVSSKIDESALREALSSHKEPVPLEDIDNPQISLDCFVFI